MSVSKISVKWLVHLGEISEEPGSEYNTLALSENELCINEDIDQGNKLVNEEVGFWFIAQGNTCIDWGGVGAS